MTAKFNNALRGFYNLESAKKRNHDKAICRPDLVLARNAKLKYKKGK